MLTPAAGNALPFDGSLCQTGKNFANTIWTAYRLVEGWEVNPTREIPAVNKAAIHWYKNLFQQTLSLIDDHYSKYRISDALMSLYKLIWDDYCSWFLEMVKPSYGDPIDSGTLEEVKTLFEDNLRLLHPFMPFITEELWENLGYKEKPLILSEWDLNLPEKDDVKLGMARDRIK